MLGGAANLWDCIPSKAMIATGEVLSVARRSSALGLSLGDDPPDLEVLRERLRTISGHLSRSTAGQLETQGVRIVQGVARLVGPHDVEINPHHDGGATASETLSADAVLLATGSTPRVPDWVEVDGERILITRQAYPPPVIPEELVVVGSGVTGVEFVHMFRSLGSPRHVDRLSPAGPADEGSRGSRRRSRRISWRAASTS